MGPDDNGRDGFRLYTIHSQKGGVGKTSLAIAIACLESLVRKAQVLLIDTDLTGTCLGDALGMPVPKARRGKQAGRKRWFNEMLLAPPAEFLRLTHYGARLDPERRAAWEPFLHRWPKVKGQSGYFDFIQSNSALRAVRQIVPSLAQEHHLHFYAERLHDIVTAAAQLGYQTVIIDLPPGLFGLSEAAMFMALGGLLEADLARLDLHPAKTAPCAMPILVTAGERADYRSSLLNTWLLQDEAIRDGRETRKQIIPPASDLKKADGPGLICFNKFVADGQQGVVDPAFAYKAIAEELRSCISNRCLGGQANGFRQSDRTVLDEGLKRLLAQRGRGILPLVPGHRLDRVVPAVERWHSQGEGVDPSYTPIDPMSAWVQSIHDAIGLGQKRVQP